MNFEIHGSNGSIIGLGNLNRNAAGKLIYRDKTGSEEAIFLPEKEHLLLYVKEIEQFTEHVSKSVKSNSEYIFGLEQGINNMKVITSAYLSAEQNRAILL